VGGGEQARLGARRRPAAGAAGDHCAAGGQPGVRLDDSCRTAAEHLFHRLSADAGAGLVIVWIGMADILAQYQIFVGEALAMLRELVGLR